MTTILRTWAQRAGVRAEENSGKAFKGGIQPDDYVFEDEMDEGTTDGGGGGGNRRVVQARVSLTNEKQKAFVALHMIVIAALTTMPPC